MNEDMVSSTVGESRTLMKEMRGTVFAITSPALSPALLPKRCFANESDTSVAPDESIRRPIRHQFATA